MYDLSGSDTDREWIEVYNDGSSAVDLTSFKLFESNVNHSLILVSGHSSIQAGGYAVVVSDYDKWKLDWPNFSGNVFDSSFSLGNSEGELLVIKDDNLSIENEYTYNTSLGGAGDGNSLQRDISSWFASIPTPGLQNTKTSTSTSTSSNTENNSSSNTAGVSNFSLEQNKINTKIIHDQILFSKVPTKFTVETTDSSNKRVIYGKYLWNFGDGMSLESKVGEENKVEHTYFYEGEYNMTLEYYSANYFEKPNATDDSLVKVIPMPIIIKSIGDERDFFVELYNTSKYNIDIGGFVLAFADKKFVLPKNTVLFANKNLMLSPLITRFSFSDNNDLRLLNSFYYPLFEYKKEIKEENSPPEKAIAFSGGESKEIKTKIITQTPSQKTILERQEFNPRNMESSTISGLENNKENTRLFLYLLPVLFIAFFGAFIVYKIRQNKRKELGDDFEILEE
jgi:hypothetical protein